MGYARGLRTCAAILALLLVVCAGPRTASADSGELPVEIVPTTGQSPIVGQVAFSRDGRLALSASIPFIFWGGDHTIKLWDIESGRQIRTFQDDGRINSFAMAPDGSRLSTVNDDGAMALWDVASGRLLHRIAGPKVIPPMPYLFAFSPDSKIVLLGGNDGGVKLFDAASGAPIRDLEE